MKLIGSLVSVVLGLSAHTSVLAVEVDIGVPSPQAHSLFLDQGYLKKLQFQNNQIDENTKALLGIRGALNSQVLQEWLNERVGLVISEKMDIMKTVLVAPGKARYPEPATLPDPDPQPAKPAGKPSKPKPGSPGDDEGPVLVMSNTGAALYMMGKENQVLLALRKTDGELFPILTPRGGVIQIGAGLFLERFRVNPAAQDLPANSLSRLSTLFHESRHSDGHGKSLGFMHAICPEGHAYAGFPACDKNLNGPYTVGAQVLSSLIQACGDCSTKEKTVLKMIEADSRSRILKSYKDRAGKLMAAVNWSDRPEKMVSFARARESGLERH
jgi:hypothetical protein